MSYQDLRQQIFKELQSNKILNIMKLYSQCENIVSYSHASKGSCSMFYFIYLLPKMIYPG